MTIPKLIHQYWSGENGNVCKIPPDQVVNTNSWDTTHPDFLHKIWHLQEIESLLSNFHGLNVLDCVRACRFVAMQSDIIRMALVYEYGGIWSDIKNLVLQPFLHNFLELDYPFITEHPSTAIRPHPNDYLCNALFGAPPQSDMIFDILTAVCFNINSRIRGGVYGVTGGSVILKVIARAQQNNTPYQFLTLRYNETWGIRVKRTSATYNNGGRHWSERQKTESLYLDE